MASCSSEDFRNKEVISVCDGRRLGYVCEIEFDVCEIEFDVCDGRITAIVVKGEGGLFGGKGGALCLPWDSIRKIGEDIILVEGPPPPSPPERGRRRGTV